MSKFVKSLWQFIKKTWLSQRYSKSRRCGKIARKIVVSLIDSGHTLCQCTDVCNILWFFWSRNSSKMSATTEHLTLPCWVIALDVRKGHLIFVKVWIQRYLKVCEIIESSETYGIFVVLFKSKFVKKSVTLYKKDLALSRASLSTYGFNPLNRM